MITRWSNQTAGRLRRWVVKVRGLRFWGHIVHVDDVQNPKRVVLEVSKVDRVVLDVVRVKRKVFDVQAVRAVTLTVQRGG
jgi:hypothetical protein